MSKPIYRREIRLSRRFAKERELIKLSKLPYIRLNINDRMRAESERLMVAIDQSYGRFA